MRTAYPGRAAPLSLSLCNKFVKLRIFCFNKLSNLQINNNLIYGAASAHYMGVCVCVPAHTDYACNTYT